MTDVQKNPASAGFFVFADARMVQIDTTGVKQLC
jgi:hypothetical protein